MAGVPPKSMLAGLLQALEGPAPLVILPHDNPDPDALASAAALKFLVQTLIGTETVIAQGGSAGRPENRAVPPYRRLHLQPVGEMDLPGRSHDRRVPARP